MTRAQPNACDGCDQPITANPDMVVHVISRHFVAIYCSIYCATDDLVSQQDRAYEEHMDDQDDMEEEGG